MQRKASSAFLHVTLLVVAVVAAAQAAGPLLDMLPTRCEAVQCVVSALDRFV
jgi:hypothetical protein